MNLSRHFMLIINQLNCCIRITRHSPPSGLIPPLPSRKSELKTLLTLAHPCRPTSSFVTLPYSLNTLPVHTILLNVPKSKFGKENFPELPVLPAVDQDVDSGVEHQEEVGHWDQLGTPAMYTHQYQSP